MATSKMFHVSVALLLSLTIVGGAEVGADLTERSYSYPKGETFRFTVAENFKKFAFDKESTTFGPVAKYGMAFITQGYIYPQGVISKDANGRWNGVNKDGSPEFPEMVRGMWICSGHLVGDKGLNITTGPVAYTTQYYDFRALTSKDYGGLSLSSIGLELVDVGVPVQRAIIGGTGVYVKATGLAIQKFLGLQQNGPGVTLDLDLSFYTS